MDSSQKKIKKILFIDTITYSSLMHILKYNHSIESIWYFEIMTPHAQQILRVFRVLRLIRADVYRIDRHVGEIRNADGECEFSKIKFDSYRICKQIKREMIIQEPLIKSMKSEWDIAKAALYIERILASSELNGEMKTVCLRIGLVEWMMRLQLRIEPTRCVLLIKKTPWYSYLIDFASTYNVKLDAYRPSIFAFLPYLLRIVKRITRFLVRLLTFCIPSGINVKNKTDSIRTDTESRAVTTPSNTTIGIKYMSGSLSLDPQNRSEFFFLLGSGIPLSEVLLYNVDADILSDKDTLNQIHERKIRLMGNGSGGSVWRSTPLSIKTFLRIVVKIITNSFKCLVQGHRVSIYYVDKLISIARDYAFWYDFYFNNNVVVDVCCHGTIGQVLALDALQGVSISYQNSISDANFIPDVSMSCGQNIQFLFSDTFVSIWRRMEIPIDVFVKTGFIYDGAFPVVRKSKNIMKIRSQLQDQGARFIICFFDEMSLNRWDMPIPHEDAAKDYEFLLEWMLEDPTLGVVFKPKKSGSLLERISSVSHLIDRINGTGRCSFLMDGNTSVGSTYPVEAALMADLCIGILFGGTAALEARLAGVPTVLLDAHWLSEHPFYHWGRGQVVFDSWQSLRNVIEQYRKTPEAYPDFGDWSPGLKDLDPYQDGQGGLRMGYFTRWVYEALKQGVDRKTAIEIAKDKFERKWGISNVSWGIQHDGERKT